MNKKNKEKILLITPYNRKKIKYYKGGIGTWSILFIDRLIKHHINFSIVDTTPIGSRLKKLNTKTNFFTEVIRSIRILLSTFLKRLFFRPTVVHLNSSCASFGLIRDNQTINLINTKKSKVILHLHCDVKKAIGDNDKKKKNLRKLIRKSHIVMVLNDESKNFCRSLDKNVELILVPNFIREDRVLTNNKTIKPSIEKAVFVGFLQKEKGFYELAALAKEFSEIQFILVGDRKEETLSTELSSNVILVPDATNEKVYEYLDDGDVFIFPSYSEGFSYALLEAMSRGLPIVCTDVGANKLMIGDKGGVVVDVGDIEGMSAAIHHMQNPTVRKKMSLENINKVKSEFTTEKVVDSILGIYRK